MIKNLCNSLAILKKAIMRLLQHRRDSSVALLLQNDKNNKLKGKAYPRHFLVILSESLSEESLCFNVGNKIVMIQK